VVAAHVLWQKRVRVAGRRSGGSGARRYVARLVATGEECWQRNFFFFFFFPARFAFLRLVWKPLFKPFAVACSR